MRALDQAESFYLLRMLAGFNSSAAAAAWLDLSSRQVRRYERGEQSPPRPVTLALRARAGDLGALSDAWDGWTIHAGALWAPGVRWSEGITPGEVLALPWLLQLKDAVISGTL